MRFTICVLRSSFSLDDAVCKRLFASAQAMHAAGNVHSMELDLQGGAGRVTTDWSSAALGTFSGPQFVATVEIGSRSWYGAFHRAGALPRGRVRPRPAGASLALRWYVQAATCVCSSSRPGVPIVCAVAFSL